MTLPDIYDLTDYWAENPPVHEMLAMLAGCYTTWKPSRRSASQDDQRKSLEERWKSGALNPAQMYQMMGGPLSAGRKRSDGKIKRFSGLNMPGGPFPDHETQAALKAQGNQNGR
ncbi:MAG: hypothetical protein WCD42_01595 [Rhizomicrobium sp.]